MTLATKIIFGVPRKCRKLCYECLWLFSMANPQVDVARSVKYDFGRRVAHFEKVYFSEEKCSRIKMPKVMRINDVDVI